MRFAARLAGVLLLTAGMVACDSDPVQQLDSQVVTISFRSTSVSAQLFNVWDAIEDNDLDNQPDPGTTPFLFCVRLTDTQGAPVTANVNSAPWPEPWWRA